MNNLGSGSTENNVAFLAQKYILKWEAQVFGTDKHQEFEKVYIRYMVLSGHKEQTN